MGFNLPTQFLKRWRCHVVANSGITRTSTKKQALIQKDQVIESLNVIICQRWRRLLSVKYSTLPFVTGIVSMAAAQLHSAVFNLANPGVTFLLWHFILQRMLYAQ